MHNISVYALVGDESTSAREKFSISTVPRADDETFTSFFSNVSLAKCEAETLDVAESDFDVITTFAERQVYFFPVGLSFKYCCFIDKNYRLGTRRTVKTQRRRLPSKNPLRTLAARTDIKDEYTEMTTGVAERLMKTLNLEKRTYNLYRLLQYCISDRDGINPCVQLQLEANLVSRSKHSRAWPRLKTSVP